MKFAYADPPYIGQAHLYAENREVDHQELIDRLYADYPDGWALSCSSPSLAEILGMCRRWPEEGIMPPRVMAWVKPFASFKPNVGVAYAWEPVLVHGGRRRAREQLTVRDRHSAPITLRKGLTGAKPPSFCRWLLDVLNYQDGDTLDDLYPGTGVMGDVLAHRQLALEVGA